MYSSTDDSDEPFTGDATIEDLLSKFGNSSKRDRKRRPDEEEDESTGEDRGSRRQRDAIRRTLNQLNDDE